MFNFEFSRNRDRKLRNKQKDQRRKDGRQAFSREMKRAFQVEQLEDRRLLAFAPFEPLQLQNNGNVTLSENQILLVATGPSPLDLQIDTTHNVNAADTTNTDVLQVGGSSGLNLTGAGYTVGVWEAGGGRIRSTHQELTGRVTNGDAGGSLDDHATHVAGTIGASGINAAAKGMATAVDLVSYTSADDTTEMAAAAGTIQASNHSYGLINGWHVFADSDWGITTTSGSIDVWFSDYSVSSTESLGFGKYDSNAQGLDAVLASNPNLLSVWSAGNDRNDVFGNASSDNTYITYFSSDPGGIGFSGASYYLVSNATIPAPGSDGNNGTGFDSLSQDQNAKNSLVVGAINDITIDPYAVGDISATSFSSYGPTDDGRIKPDVVGNGASLTSSLSGSDTAYGSSSGTSMSAPNVTGTAVLLMEHYNDTFGTNPNSATSKGLLIHTATDGGNVGPDYSYGWGLVNAEAAADFITDASMLGTGSILEMDTYTGSEITFTVGSDGTGPLKATIVWTDVAGPSQSTALDDTTSVLVNDLDLTITDGGGTYYPWTLNPASPATPAVRTTTNHRDNVEQVLIDAPAAGAYTIRVNHTGGAFNQAFTLLISGADLSTTDVGVTAGNLVITDAAGGDTDDTVEISRNGANIRIFDPNNLLAAGAGATQVDPNTVEIPVASVTGLIQFDGLGGNDSLLVDFSDGNPIPAGGLTFNGGLGDDSLEVVGTPTGGTLDATTVNFLAPDGNGNNLDVVMDPNSGVGGNETTIRGRGLSPLSLGGDVNNLIFNLNAGGVTATLLDDGPGSTDPDATDDAGVSYIQFSAGAEDTEFMNPNVSLQVNDAGGAKTINVQGLDGNWAANLDINDDGASDNTINFRTNPTNLNGGTLTADALQINVTAAVSTTGAGAIDLDATRQVSVWTIGSLATVNGDITVDANPGGAVAVIANAGVQISGGVSATGAGNIVLTGHGGSGGGGINGILVFSATGIVSAAGGNITLTGTGSAGGASSRGVDIEQNAKVTNTGAGGITINGTGTNAVSQSQGVAIIIGATVSTVDGPLSITGNGTASATRGVGIQDSNVSATGTGTISITGNGGATSVGVLGTATINSGSGTVTLLGENHVRFENAASIMSASGTVTVTGDTAGGANGGQITMADGTSINAGSGQVFLSTDGNITLSTITTTNAANPSIDVQSDSGSISDNTAAEMANLTTAVGGSVVLRAATGIGNAGVDAQDIDVATRLLAATTATGDISIQDNGALDITTVDGLNGVSITTGGAGDDILLRDGTAGVNENLRILQPITNSGSGNVTVFADGTTFLDELRIEANVTANGGNVLLVGFGDIEFANTPTVSTTGTGTIGVHAGATLTHPATVNDAAGTTNATINQNVQEFNIQSGGGNVTLNAPFSVLISVVNAGTGTVFVNADTDGGGSGSIFDVHTGDGAGNANIIANAAVLQAGNGIGVSEPLDTQISQLDVTNTTGASINIHNDGALTTMDLGGPNANSVSGFGGGGEIRAASPLTLTGVNNTTGNFTYTAFDDGNDATDILLIDSGASVMDNTSLTLNGGDAVTFHADGSSTATAPVININVDVAPLPGDDDAAGGVVNIPDATTLFGATTITGGDDEDTFNIVPQTNATSTIHINGGDPTAPLPADVLNLNVNGLTGELNLIPTANGFAGFFTAGGVEDVSFMNVETINPILNGGTLDVRVRWDLSNDGTLTAAPYNLGAGQGLGDNTTNDTTLVSLSPGGTNLVIDANAMTSVMQLALAGVNSLRVDGSGDDDDLVINDVNGLPSFGGTVPGVGNNGNIAGAAELSFNGGGGNDGIRFDLDLANTNGSTIDQTYAVGNGVGGGSGVGASTGEILTTDNGTGTNLQIWFTGLEPITTAGTPGGTLTVLGDTNNNTIDVIPGPAGFTRIAATTPVFETFDFAANAFTALEVYGMEGADFIDLQAVDPAEGSLATIRLDGDTVANTDASTDTVRVRTLPATSTANLFGGSGDDTFFVGTSGSPLFGPGSTAGVLGQVFVSPAVDEGGNDTLQVSASNDPGRIVLLTSTTMEGITGFADTPDVTYGTGDQIETIILITSDAADDTINIQSTRSGSVYNVDTGRFGAGNDTVNISSDAPANAGTLNDIDGQVNLNFGTGNDSLNISDLGDVAADTYTLTEVGPVTELTFNDGDAAVDIRYNVSFGGGANNSLDHFRLIGSNTGNNTYNINDTTATVSNLIEDGDATVAAPNHATFNITPENIQPGATNDFDGFDGNDTFNVLFANGGVIPGAAGTTFVIRGNAPATDTDNRDRVNVSTAADVGGPRVLNFVYQDNASGDVDILGLSTGPNNTPLNIDTSETVVYTGNGANDDVIRVTGAANQDSDLTVALRDNNSSAVVFNGGTPYDEAAPPSLLDPAHRPGVAGGGNGPDIRIDGMSPVLTVDGNSNAPGVVNNTGNRAFVYAPSELALISGTLDVFGFGAGVLVPGFGVGNADDIIDVNNTGGANDISPAEVDVLNDGGPQLVSVDIVEATFVQDGPAFSAQRPALIVNGGDEAAIDPVLQRADLFVATGSVLFNTQVNGNLPDPAVLGVDGLPLGDQMTLVSPDSINMFSDKATPPNVTTTFGNNIFGIRDSSIERKLVMPGNGVLNLIGDANDAAVDQADNFVVVGRDVDGNGDGVNEGTVAINGSTPILFDGVSDMNVYGFDLVGEPNYNAPNPNRADGGAGGIDTLDIRAYADDTPRGWGIDVLFNEGNPVGMDGDQADLLIYRTSLFGGQVSEDIVIQPSASQAGEVVVTNRGFGTPIVDIDFLANLDIVVIDDDGFANDTDTLTLRGSNPDPANNLTGNDYVNADFTQNGDGANPVVRVLDLGPDGILNSPDNTTVPAAGDDILLYRLRTNPVAGAAAFTFDNINFDLLGGDDTLSLIGRADGSLTVNYDGGNPAGSDTLRLPGTAAMNDTYSVTPGASSDAGVATALLAGATAATVVNFTHTEAIAIDGGGGTGNDALTANGTGGNDVFTLAGLPGGGSVQVNAGPTITYANFGSADNTITLSGGAGTDSAAISTSAANDEAVAYSSTSATAGQLRFDAGNGQDDIELVGIESLSVDALENAGDADALTVTSGNAIFSSVGPESGTVTPLDGAGNPLLALSYSHFETAGAAANAGILLVEGTEGDDTITVLANGNVVVTDEFGNTNTYAAANFGGLIINALGGDDAITINASANFAANGIRVIGGDNGDGSDTLTVLGDNANAGAETIGVALATGQVTGVVGGPIALTGIEHLTVDAQSQLAGTDTINVTEVGATSALQTVSLLNGETVRATGTAGDETIEVQPTAAGAGRFWATSGQPVVTYSGATTLFTVDGGGAGDFDVLHLLGTEDADTVTTPSATSVMVSGGRVDFANTERLDISTFGGNDTITLSNGIAIPKIIYAGAGNDTIDASAAAATDPTIYGGDGDDMITGSPGPDLIFGGAGNDTISGLAGDDVIYGEAGNDVVIGGTGTDRFFGGEGSDMFTWNQGDGDDFVEGDEGDDVVIFNGATAAQVATENFTISAVAGGGPAARVLLARTEGGVDIDMGGVEQINLNGQSGVENVTVNDLTGTSLSVLNLDLGAADMAVDNITVNGRMTDDSLAITTAGAGLVSVTGLAYNVNLSSVEAADTLTVDGQAGHDTLNASTLPAGVVVLTLNGGAGDDSLYAGANGDTLSGGADNDTLIGGAGNDTITGGTGDDLIDGRGGTNAIDGGAGGDTILVSGTDGSDSIGVTNGASLVITGGVSAGTNNLTSIEEVRVEAGEGDDTITITPTNAGLNYTVLGGDPIGAVGDTLILAAAGATYLPGPESDSGAFAVGNDVVSFDEIEAVTVNNAGAVIVCGTGDDDQITVVGTGAASATVTINAGPTITYNGLTALTIDAKAGDDDIDLDLNALNVPIVVNGGSPVADQDTVTIAGSAANDAPVYAPGASVTAAPAGQAETGTFDTNTLGTAIDLNGIERLVYDGRGGNDLLTIQSPNDTTARTATLTPGSANDSGTIGIDAYVPLEFQNLGAGSIVYDEVNAAVNDTLVYLGTDLDDAFGVTAAGVVSLNGRVTVDIGGDVATLRLAGLDGDDTFTLVPVAGVLIDVEGGNPDSGSDVLNYTSAAAAVLELGLSSIEEPDGTDVVSYSGIETLNFTHNAFGLTVEGSASDDRFDVTPQSATLVDIQRNGAAPVVHAIGGGTVTIDPLAGGTLNTIHLIGTAAGDAIGVTDTTLTLTGRKGVTYTTANTQAIEVTAGLGDDTISVAAATTTATFIHGGAGADADALVVSAATNARVTQAADSKSGVVDGFSDASADINYTGIEALRITSGAANSTLTVRGTDDNDTIAIGPTGTANEARVWINDGTVITANAGGANANFGGTGGLLAQGRFGSDAFSVTPIANVPVQVAGMDSASDHLTVHGQAGATADAVTITPTGADSGSVAMTGFGTVTFSSTESLVYDGLGGNDTLTFELSALAATTTTYTPGAATDAASLQVRTAATNLVPMAFGNLGVAGVPQAVTINGSANSALVYEGTAANDTFTVTGLTAPARGRVLLNSQLPVETNANVTNLTLNGHDGDDVFNVTATVAAPLTYTNIGLSGGNPSASDVANLNGDGATGIVVGGLGSPTPTVAGGGLGLVALTSVEVANVAIGGNNQRIEFQDAGASDDDVQVTVLSATAGVVHANGVAPVVNYTGANNVAGSEPYFNFVGGGEDKLSVYGNALAQRVDVDASLATGGFVAFDDTPVGAGTLGQDGRIAFPAVDAAGPPAAGQPNALSVYGLEGDDTFNVTAGPNVPIFIDGGDPIGSTAGDAFNVIAGGGLVTFEPGPENDEGGILVGANARISFDHIEAGQVTGAGCALIAGTNGDDDITIIARTELANPPQFVGADGVQDFTSSVNSGVEILWLNTADLFVDGLSGDDDITVQTRALNAAGAPVAANWDVDVRIVGGAPSAPTFGDRVVIQTPGTDSVIYTPTSSETGVIVLDTDADGVYTAASQDTQIQLLAQFDVDCDNDGVNEYRSSNGGIESLFLDGENGNDAFAIVGTAGNDTITHMPGSGLDEGNLRVDTMLAISYQNLGATGSVTVDGAGHVAGTPGDTLVAYGTGLSDTITVARNSATVGSITVNNHLPILTSATTGAAANTVENYVIEALEGDDAITINNLLATGVASVAVNGGGPGGSDTLSINGAAGTAETFTVTPAAIPGNGNVAVNAVNNPYTGIEHLFLAGNANDADNLTINDDGQDNVWTVDAGSIGDSVQIDDRESIDISVFNNVTLTNGFGTDHFRLHPTNLVSFAGTFTVNGDAAVAPANADDVIEFIGTEAADVVTATATTVTVNGVTTTVGNTNFAELRITTLGGADTIGHDGQGGNPAPLALGLANVLKVIDAGAGNDIVNASLMQDADIFGGAGNDFIIGSPLADNIYGGSGNDILIGGDGVDHIYGEDGNDIFGNPSAVENGAADDRGNDFFFGGAGSDTFVWEPGDGSDTIEGGSEEGDRLLFFGSAGDETFNVFASLTNPARAILFRNAGNITIDMAGIDQIDVSGNAGNDRYVVGRANDGDSGAAVAATNGDDPTATLSDLSTTEVRVVNLRGVAGNDQFFVDGRPADDNLLVSVESAATNVIRVAGLPYDVRVVGADVADRLTVRGNEGADTIKTANVTGPGAVNVEDVIGITFTGGAGNDVLHADAILIGGMGDDFLEGGAGNDMLFGNAGEDTMVGGGGQDTYDGGADFDTILIRGTSGKDLIRVEQPSANVLEYIVTDQFGTIVESATVAGGTQDAITNVEEARVEAGAGADTIRVAIADALFNAAGASLRMTVNGGDDAASDRLAIVDVGTPDLSILRQNNDITAGTVEIGPGNAEAFLHVFSGIEFVQVVADTLAPAAPVNIESATIPNRLVVFKDDANEHNNDRNNATHLGAATTVNIDPTIDPGPGAFGLPADSDWYRVEALDTGTIDFQIVFERIAAVGARPGLPGNGELDIRVYDVDGTLLTGFWDDNTDNANNNERVRIPAVQGEIYYFEVVGVGAAINAYDVTAINLPTLVPHDLELDDKPANGTTNPPGQTENSDTGRSLFDNRTYDTTPTIVFRFDDNLFRNDLPGNDLAGLPLGDNPIGIPFRPGAAQPTQPGYAIAIFDEGDNPGFTVVEEPQTPLGFASLVGDTNNNGVQDPGETIEWGVYQFTTPVLAEGTHFLTARVQMLDPANPQATGFGARSDSLEIIVDTTPPATFFGNINLADTTQGLAADSDSGVAGYPATNTDRATNDTTPTFFGTAEANAIVRVYVDTNGVAGLQSRESGAANPDLFLGLTVANPLDGEGTGQFPRGTWQLDSTIDLNNPLLGFTKDGLRRIYITGEDVAGNITPDANADLLNIFLDTQGPQVTAVRINSPTDGFDLFDPKRPADGTLIPTPLVNSIVINVRDLPNRSNVDPNFLYAALYEAVAENPGHFSIVGDNVGVIPVTKIDFVPDQNPATAAIDPQVNGQPAVGYIVLHFSLPGADGVVGTADDILNPLPDDRYTLSISDLVVDPVGNALDGETDPVQPHEDPTFPSGDIVPGGDFVARFTVDTRPEMGVWAAGTIWVDTNGNYRFDNDAVDFVNRDITYGIGFTSDDIFAGNFSPTAASVADGFDKIAAYGFDLQGAGGFRWLIDLDNNGTPDAAASLAEPNGLNGTPVAGNFDGIGAAAIANGDEVSVFDGILWRFDTNHDFQLDLAATLNVDTQPAHAGTGLRLKGFPITGDFDGDGRTDLATWTDDYFRFDLSSIGGTTIASLPGIQGRAEVVVRFGFTGVREVPVAADLNFDGLDDVGLWTPDRAGLTPDENGEFYWIVSDSFNNRDNTGAPIVTGGIQNGAVVATTANGGKIATDPVRGDNVYLFSPTPFTNDLYINFGNQYARPIVGNFDPPTALQTGEQVATGNLHTNLNDPLDVNDDGVVSPIDAGILINHLNASGAGRLEGAAGAAPYLDVNMDGFISPIDVALVVNHLNSAKPTGEGEAAVTLVAEGEAPAEPLFESATLESVALSSAITSAAGSSVGSSNTQLPLPSEILQPNSALGTPVVRRESTDVRRESASTANASLATPASTSSDPSLLASLRDEAFGIESLDDLLDDLALDISHNRQDDTATDELFRQLGS